MSSLSSRKSHCPTRPFHLWNPTGGVHGHGRRIPSMYFSDPKRAHWGALKEMRWAHIGTTIEVLDVMQGKMLGSYTRKIKTIEFTGR